MKKNKTEDNKNSIVVEKTTVHHLTQAERELIISQMILNGVPKAECIEYIMKNFVDRKGVGPSYKTAYTRYRQAYAQIYAQSNLKKEELRQLNLARLEELYDRCMNENSRVSDIVKVIDLTGKMGNLYQQEVAITEAPTEFSLSFDSNPIDGNPIDNTTEEK